MKGTNLTHPQSNIERLLQKLPLVFRPSKAVFTAVFVLVYLLSGIITMLDVIPYRMGVVSLLVMPLFLFYRLKVDKVFISYSLLTVLITLSALYNNSTLVQFLLFLRIIIFSYLIYFLVKLFVTEKNAETILKIAIIIGVIQLPIVIFQIYTYDLLPSRITQGMNLVVQDYDFGTFNFKGDSKLALYLLALLTLLLFKEKARQLIPYSGFVIIWFTITVMILNSEISKLILIGVWATFFLINFRRPFTIYLFAGLSFVLVGLWFLGILPDLIESALRPLRSPYEGLVLGIGMDNKVRHYLNGGYSRAGALYYYARVEDVLWLGDGPSLYSNPISKERFRGNVGHIYTFYSEVGLIATFLSYFIFFQIMLPLNGLVIRFSMYRLLIFFAVFVLSFTTQIMNDISVVLTYCLLAKMHLLNDPEPATAKTES